MPEFTWKDLADECDREAYMREGTYRIRVLEGTLTPELAERRLELMKEAGRRFRSMHEHGYFQPKLSSATGVGGGA